MISSVEELKAKLAKYLIKIGIEEYILLEEYSYGGATIQHMVKPEILYDHIVKAYNPLQRPDIVVILEGIERSMRELTVDEYYTVTGYKKYIDRWAEEGITL